MTRPADIVLTNAKVITVDARFSIAEAIAIAGDRILAVGSAAQINSHITPDTRVFDLKGRAIMPGLIDGHSHMDREGLKGVFPSLGTVRSIKDVQDRIAELARGKPARRLDRHHADRRSAVLFRHARTAGGKALADAAGAGCRRAEQPGVYSFDLGVLASHAAIGIVRQQLALQRAGITRDTISPVDTLVIDRDSRGDPTGDFLRE